MERKVVWEVDLEKNRWRAAHALRLVRENVPLLDRLHDPADVPAADQSLDRDLGLVPDREASPALPPAKDEHALNGLKVIGQEPPANSEINLKVNDLKGRLPKDSALKVTDPREHGQLAIVLQNLNRQANATEATRLLALVLAANLPIRDNSHEKSAATAPNPGSVAKPAIADHLLDDQRELSRGLEITNPEPQAVDGPAQAVADQVQVVDQPAAVVPRAQTDRPEAVNAPAEDAPVQSVLAESALAECVQAVAVADRLDHQAEENQGVDRQARVVPVDTVMLVENSRPSLRVGANVNAQRICVFNQVLPVFN